jgi:hypothetical protein
VTVSNGPAQLERYLGYLANRLGVGPEGVRGILVQKHPWASPALRERLAASEYHMELWSLDQNSEKKWHVERVFGPSTETRSRKSTPRTSRHASARCARVVSDLFDQKG